MTYFNFISEVFFAVSPCVNIIFTTMLCSLEELGSHCPIGTFIYLRSLRLLAQDSTYLYAISKWMMILGPYQHTPFVSTNGHNIYDYMRWPIFLGITIMISSRNRVTIWHYSGSLSTPYEVLTIVWSEGGALKLRCEVEDASDAISEPLLQSKLGVKTQRSR